MMGCCGHFSTPFRSKNESDLLFFTALVSPSGPGAGVCWSCLLKSSSPLFFSHAVKSNSSSTTGAGGWKEDEWRGEQRPQHWGPRPATFTHVIFANNEREPLRGQRWTATAHSQQAENAAGPHPTWQESPLQVKGHHLHPPQDANLQRLSYLHKFGSTGWI